MTRWLLPLLLLASVLVHWPGGRADFSYDDRDFVETNQSIRTLAGALAAFGEPFPPHQPQRALYRPLTNLSYAFDHAIWGEQARGYHLANNRQVISQLPHLSREIPELLDPIA